MADEIKTLFAWVTVDEHGLEKLAMVRIGSTVIPLVGAGGEGWKDTTRALASQMGCRVRLKRFAGGRALETLEGKK